MLGFLMLLEISFLDPLQILDFLKKKQIISFLGTIVMTETTYKKLVGCFQK